MLINNLTNTDKGMMTEGIRRPMADRKWSHLGDSNSGPADYKSAALPGYAKVA